MSDNGYRSPLDPEWDQLGIPVDNNAEPEDAEPSHEVETEQTDGS